MDEIIIITKIAQKFFKTLFKLKNKWLIMNFSKEASLKLPSINVSKSPFQISSGRKSIISLGNASLKLINSLLILSTIS